MRLFDIFEGDVPEQPKKTVAKTWDQMTPKEKISGVKGRTVWNEKTQKYYTVFDVPADTVEEVKQRLDPKCWTGKHKEGTKIKGGVRVNNCVPNEAANPAQQAAIAIAKKKEQGVEEGDESRYRFIRHNIWTVMDGDEEVMQHPVEGDPFFSAKKFMRDLDDEGYEFTHVVSPEGKITYLPQFDPRNFPKDEVDEGTQRVDSLVTDALKLMRGPELADAVQALKTVLGDREFSSRRGHYNFYIRQMLDMYKQRGVAESADEPVHRVGLTVTDPNHPMVSKRGETIQKTVRVTGGDRDSAIKRAIAHHQRKGYKVHDHHYIGTVDEAYNNYHANRTGFAKSKRDMSGEGEPEGMFTVMIDGRPWKQETSNNAFQLATNVKRKYPNKQVAVKWPNGQLNTIAEDSWHGQGDSWHGTGDAWHGGAEGEV